ncbi:hypothetical protein NKW53_12010 [Acetobacter orientalis]|uniref:hypothetical protein n=1 Tax=Acetobacter orientalis TaxID=146474 RepID=UPI0020A03659|nr:hypothetical protein [Acetobacter orientalis]MCP1216790.1 hypothetical protein [Acetobacter orientalis]MCP1219517.1 hypothetical protein [Acetobacter orientalis]
MVQQKRFQYRSKNPQAAFWAQTRDYYRKFRSKTRLAGLKVWAREREEYCTRMLENAHSEVAA